MQTILIPTDFNTAALNCIPSLCKQHKDQELRFNFVHMFKLSDSIGELLMLSRRNREFEQVSDEFYSRCNQLKAEYKQIKAIKIDFLYGSTLSYFKNYLENNDINAVLDASDCFVGKINKSSIDPQVLVQKSGLPIVSVLPQAVEEELATQAHPMYDHELSAV